MKPLLMLVALILLIPLEARSQNREPVCGVPIVTSPEVRNALALMLSKDPGLRDQLNHHSELLASANLQVGAVDTFWTYNFTSQNFDRTPAELRATGALSYVWVAADTLAAYVDSSVVAAILQALESKTPPASRDSTKGILQLERQYFGNPPNIDPNFNKGAGDGRTHFLIYDIKDGWSGIGGYLAGYFFSVDVDPDVFPARSNRRDMLYIDSFPGIYYNGQRDPQGPLGTLAHEFQHLVHWNYDQDEDTFFDEGLSEYSSYVCGYGLRSPAGYLKDPGVTFLGWRFGDNVKVLDDYSRAALWTFYLGEQFGPNFIQKLTQNPGIGPAGFNAAVSAAGLNSDFATSVLNFHLANYLQDRGINGVYGYIDTLVIPGRPKLYKSYLGSQATGGKGGLLPLAVDYVKFSGLDSIVTTFGLTAGGAVIRALRFTDAAPTVNTVLPGVFFQSTFLGTNRSDLVFVVHNNGQSNNTDYAYTSLGRSRSSTAFELRHDDGSSFSSPNTQFLSGDTAFVVFDAMEGGKIDSVALWFQSAGSARLFVRDANTRYDLSAGLLTGLGGRPRMPASMPFTVSDTGYFRTVVDLRGYAIPTAQDFVIEMIYGSGAPDPLLRRDSSQSVLHSYLSLSGQPTPGRTMYSSLGDFYVRAYLSPGPPPLPPPPPARYALRQNYPNPFNPSTRIAYDLPKGGQVRLEVFDLLGRRVAVLVDEFQSAGTPPPVEFDASRFSAGIYFYRLTAGTFSETKKMVMVR